MSIYSGQGFDGYRQDESGTWHLFSQEHSAGQRSLCNVADVGGTEAPRTEPHPVPFCGICTSLLASMGKLT